MIFLDSSLLIAFKVANDVHHKEAELIMAQVAHGNYGRSFISDYVFDEVMTAIVVRGKNHKLAVDYGSELLESVELVYVGPDYFREAWNIFSEQKKGDLSFTDTTILAVMKNHEISNLGTFDQDFQQIRGIKLITN